MSPIKKALLSLDGLSVGDGFGAAFGELERSKPIADQQIASRVFPTHPPIWHWTDDTHMALSIVEILDGFESIEQDELADAFTDRFHEDPTRGYGRGTAHLLLKLGEGGDWRELSPQQFDGGSYGNGGAMRAAPIGAYFEGNPKRAAAEAQKSAIVTHAHPEGEAGAIAVAVAAAIVTNPEFRTTNAFLTEIERHVQFTQTGDGIKLARQIPADQFDVAVKKLGTGWDVSAQDTVPFCLWCVAHHFDDFESALWTTAAGGGDRDTTCAIVGGIMALSTGEIPEKWLLRRESLPSDFAV